MLRHNGVERAAKSLVRHALFDRGEERALGRALRERGLRARLDPARLLVADAGAIELEEDSLDLVFSEDVFEHIERETLGRVVAAMAHWLRPGGLALIRPNVFTGITGGHLIEWSRRALRQPPAARRSEPWEHLRQRRYRPNTFLNELTRTDYRQLFAPWFEILAERVTQPTLGREHLDASARAGAGRVARGGAVLEPDAVRAAPAQGMSGGPRRVFLVGLYGVDNVGDDAIRLAVERAAPALGAEVSRYATRRSVEDARAVRLRADPRAYLAAIRHADTVALGGGGLLKDEGHALLRGYGILLELLATALVARALRRRVTLLAIGAGPIHTRRGRLARACDRTARARAPGARRGLGAARCARSACALSRSRPIRPSRCSTTSRQRARRMRTRPCSVRPWFMFEPDRDAREAALQTAFARAADVLAQAGSAPRFASLYWPRDREASEAVIARMEAVPGAPAVALDGPLDWDALAAQLRGARLLVAMRYHAIACAAMAGCAIVPVAYEPKVSALAEALGLPCLHVEDDDLAQRLPALAAAALADPDAHRAAPERLAELADDARAGLRRALVG